MNRNELVKRVASVMREKNIKKSVSSTKQVLHITDDEGNGKDFVVKKPRKEVIFTYDDVNAVVESMISVIEESLVDGESVSIRGFGTLYLNYRKARQTKHPVTGEIVDVKARYTPKFMSGTDLKACARVFEMKQEDKLRDIKRTLISNDEGDDI